MNAPYFEERSDPTDKETNSPVNSDIFADKVPVDPALVHETAMGGTVAAVGPMKGPGADEIPLYETPDQEIPMGGTVAAVGPMNNELRTEAIPMVETPVQQTPMGGTVAAVGPMNSEFRTDVIPLYETPVQQTPMGGTVAAVHPMNSELIADSIPMYETPVKEISMIETVAVVDLVDEKIPYKAPMSMIAPSLAPLLSREESEHFRTHWNEIQGKFVDEPRTAVQQADELVSEVIAQITQMFAKEHSSLESQWKQGNDVSTEELRKALQRYRSLFNRLVV